MISASSEIVNRREEENQSSLHPSRAKYRRRYDAAWREERKGGNETILERCSHRESRCETHLDHDNPTHELREVCSNHDENQKRRRSFRARVRSRDQIDV